MIRTRTETLNLIRSLNTDWSQHKRQIEDIAIVQSSPGLQNESSSSFYLATASDDFTILIWGTSNWKPIRNLSQNDGFHKNDVYALTTMQLKANDSTKWILASGSKDRSIIITNTTTFQPITVLYGHLKSVLCLAPLTNNSLVGDKLVSGSCDRTIIVW